MKKFWIGTSWKMNKTRVEAEAFAHALKASAFAAHPHVQSFVIPPFPYIADVADILRATEVKVGGQNLHWADEGAWTGEISAPMLVDCGATLVEIGHSERRMHFGETDETVALKVAAAVKHGLTALVCIGDTKIEYGAGETERVLARQTKALLNKVGTDVLGKVLIAYEPVWSIGENGVAAAPEFVSRQHEKISELVLQVTGKKLPILYGGSVNAENCVALAAEPHVDGLFIGRAAWNVASFIAIMHAVADSKFSETARRRHSPPT